MLCSVEECQNETHSKGLCQMHYRRQVKHGSTDKPVAVNKPGPKRDPSKPHSKFKGPKARVLKTHCVRGHEFTEENTWVSKTGARHCRACNVARMREWRPETVPTYLPDGRILANGRGSASARKTHCPKGHEYTSENTTYRSNRRFCKTCNGANSAVQRIRGYGIRQQRYDAMLMSQGNMCAICTEEFTGTAHIDHDHTCCPGRKACGKCVRGLLCSACNKALGGFRDSPELLVKAANYVSSYLS